jgi:hypothetical protein
MAKLNENRTYYVNTLLGRDNYPGTVDKPFKTIQKATDKMPKDLNGFIGTINLQAGTFTLTSSVLIDDFLGGTLKVTTSGIVKITALYGTVNNLFSVNRCDDVRVENLAFIFGGDDSTGIYFGNCKTGIVKNCFFADLGGGDTTGVYVRNSTNISIEGYNLDDRKVAIGVEGINSYVTYSGLGFGIKFIGPALLNQQTAGAIVTEISDLKESIFNLRTEMYDAVESAKLELIAKIVEDIEAVKLEIAAGDAEVLATLQVKINLVKADLANTDITLEQVKINLTTLTNYVNEQVALLQSTSDNLNFAVINLKAADAETELFKQMVIDKISILEGDLVANTVKANDALDKISNLRTEVFDAIESAKRELIEDIVNAINEVKLEIADGDSEVLTTLQEKIDLVKVDLANTNISLGQVKDDLTTLTSYVNEQVELLETKSDNLLSAVDNLQSADAETELFKQMVNDKLADLEGDLIANTSRVDDALARITDLEQKLAVGGGMANLDTTINLAKTNFKIDAYHSAVANDMYKGFIDAFMDATGLDANLSSGWIIEQNKVRVAGNLRPDTMGYWKFDETTGTILLDSSINGNHGVAIPGATRIPGKYNNCLSFNGTNQYVSLGSPASLANLHASNFSISVWVYVSSDSDLIVMSSNPGWYLMTTNRSIQFNLYRTAGVQYRKSVQYAFPSLNVWAHIVVTYNATSKTIKIYANGSESAYSTTVAGSGDPTNDSASPKNIGRRSDGLYYFNGRIDEPAIFNSELTAAEVLSIYQNGILGTGQPAQEAIIVTKAHTALAAPDSVVLVAEGSAENVYYISRDNGAHWTQATVNETTDISGQPSGTAMRVKVVIPTGKELDNIALWYA